MSQLLKKVDAASSGGEAKQMILSGEVKVNQESCLIVRKKLYSGDTVEARGQSFTIE